MFAYYARLSLASFRRNPGLTTLMVLAIALGIAVCIMTLTVYHAMSGNPIWWKNDRLYAVTMDNWDPKQTYNHDGSLGPPPQLTYKDAMHLFSSDIPERKVVMYTVDAVISGTGLRCTDAGGNAPHERGLFCHVRRAVPVRLGLEPQRR